MNTARPLHQSFSWLHESLHNDRDARRLSTNYDLFRGMTLALEIVHRSNLERMFNQDCDEGEENRPVLDIVDSETMLLFVRSTVEILATHTEADIELINDRALAALQRP